jgi:catechol 2,3-dioxygenase-like lactoylglutathione lyase family enzyme
VRLRHLALLVRDIRTSRRFYETYFGFDQGDAEWFGDVLFVRNDENFDLALMKGDHPPNPGAFHHFGFQLADRASVSDLLQRLQAQRVPIIEEVDEPSQFSFKCVDPDCYTVEVYADALGGS